MEAQSIPQGLDNTSATHRALLALIPFRGDTCEIWPSRGAGRVQPPADVHLGMRLPAIMPGTFRACRHRIPLHDRQLPAVALNDEPVVRMRTHRAAHLTPKLRNCRH